MRVSLCAVSLLALGASAQQTVDALTRARLAVPTDPAPALAWTFRGVARLRRRERRDAGSIAAAADVAEPSACIGLDCTGVAMSCNAQLDEYDVALHVGALFALLAGSALGVLAPVLAGRWSGQVSAANLGRWIVVRSKAGVPC